MMKWFLRCALSLMLSITFYITLFAQNQILNVIDFGAIGDGTTINTKAIQAAIDSASSLGGGVIYFPTGNWMTGKLFLKSNITLEITPEATILAASGPIYGAPDASAAIPGGTVSSLLYGVGLKNIIITGGGLIEGKTGITRDRGKGIGRRILGLDSCKNVKIINITFAHGGGCTLKFHSVDSMEIGNVKVLSFLNKDPEGGSARDAVNMDGSSNVYIHDCEILGSDDGFAFKARKSGYKTTTENVLIERCTFASRTCNAIQFGSETLADFHNIVIKDCKITHAGKAGIGITMNDGHIIEDVHFVNITMSDICTPFYIAMTNRKGVGKIRNISFENINCTNIAAKPEYSERSPHGYWVSTINGLKESPVENITFKNVGLHYKGGIKIKADSINPKDPLERYEPRRMGMRPASGFYIRHARNIEFQNLIITQENPDMRPPLVLDDTEKISFNKVDLPANGNVECHILTLLSKDIKADEGIIIKEIQYK